jgi:hypothetical protein
MRFCRALPLAAALAIMPLHPAAAQFGGMPGLPGSPGYGGPGAGFGGPPAAPPPACQQLITLRDQVQKDAGAIQAANQRKASPVEACKLFKIFLATESKMIKAIDDNSATCGLPPEVSKQVKDGHNRAAQIAKQVCEVAAQGPRPTGPSLSDALGSIPNVPDASNTKSGRGTYDTLTGNPLAR